MKIISIVNQKGGVGKTTTAINLGAALAKAGRRVLIVDLDPQGNATSTLNQGEPFNDRSINDLIYSAVSRGGVPEDAGSYVRYNPKEQVDFLPATQMLATAPNLLAQDRESACVLYRIFRAPHFEQYDYILLDCKPSLDLTVTNALVASNEVIIPVQPSDYAIEGLGALLDTIDGVRERYREDLSINGILVTLAATTRSKTAQAVTQLREIFGDAVYNTILPNLADAGKADDLHCSMVSMGGRLGALYEALAKEVDGR